MALPQRMLQGTVIQAATALATALIPIPDNDKDEIDVSNYNTMVIYAVFTIGDSTSYDLIPRALHTPSGDEFPICSWSPAAGTKTVTADKFRFTADGNHYIILDVRGVSRIKLYGVKTSGTTGKIKLNYSLVSE